MNKALWIAEHLLVTVEQLELCPQTCRAGCSQGVESLRSSEMAPVTVGMAVGKGKSGSL